MGTFTTPRGPFGSSIGIYAICETCGAEGHTSVECYNGPPTSEHANVVHNFNSPPQGNPYPQHSQLGFEELFQPFLQEVQHPASELYASAWIPIQSSLYLPPPQPKSSLESLMEQFIATQTKTNEALSSSINQLTSKFDAIIVHQRVMDTQIAQIA